MEILSEFTISGKKYCTVKTKGGVSYDGNIRAEYLIAFITIGEAIRYAKQVYDEIVEK